MATSYWAYIYVQYLLAFSFYHVPQVLAWIVSNEIGKKHVHKSLEPPINSQLGSIGLVLIMLVVFTTIMILILWHFPPRLGSIRHPCITEIMSSVKVASDITSRSVTKGWICIGRANSKNRPCHGFRSHLDGYETRFEIKHVLVFFFKIWIMDNLWTVK